jgi:hypothetical protein
MAGRGTEPLTSAHRTTMWSFSPKLPADEPRVCAQQSGHGPFLRTRLAVPGYPWVLFSLHDPFTHISCVRGAAKHAKVDQGFGPRGPSEG